MSSIKGLFFTATLGENWEERRARAKANRDFRITDEMYKKLEENAVDIGPAIKESDIAIAKMIASGVKPSE